MIRIHIQAGSMEEQRGHDMLANHRWTTLLRKAGVPVTGRLVFMGITAPGTLAYTKEDGLDGDEHVFTWIKPGEHPDDSAMLTMKERGLGYMIYSNEESDDEL